MTPEGATRAGAITLVLAMVAVASGCGSTSGDDDTEGGTGGVGGTPTTGPTGGRFEVGGAFAAETGGDAGAVAVPVSGAAGLAATGGSGVVTGGHGGEDVIPAPTAGTAGDEATLGGAGGTGAAPGTGGASCVPSTEVCDGVDNDCDGGIDESDPQIGVSCQTGLLGICAVGEMACDAGMLQCVPATPAAPEVCDGLDNDCDGVVDDTPAGAGVACTTALLGACAAGVRECVGGMLACEPTVVPDTQAQWCNGVDDNCDGVVDEFPEDIPCATDLPGACAEGELHCVDGAELCAATLSPGELPELCNGVDDDCDGVVDDEATDAGETCDTSLSGVCAAGVSVCSDGELACEIVTQPGEVAETCDDVDDDCDGEVDNLPCSTGLPGICELGRFDCSTNACIEATEPVEESCNGLDDDCDGVPDNGTCTEDFEQETWGLGGVGLWFPTPDGYEGGGLLADWLDYDFGCSSTSDAYIALPIDLSHATSASLTFVQRGVFGAYDSLQVIASVNGGATWVAFRSMNVTSGWSGASVPLDQFVGVADFRLGFRFYNGCFDCCGVEWTIDDLGVVIETEG